MITCTGCGATNADGVAACAKCGGTISKTGGGAQRHNALQDEKLLREVHDRQRLLRTRKGHAIVGAMTFFLLNLLMGIPMSFRPSALISNLITSLVFGLPIGWLISWRRGGRFTGALISMAAFFVVRLVLGGLAAIGKEDADAGGIVLSALIFSIAGLIPGVVIGFHVESDN